MNLREQRLLVWVMIAIQALTATLIAIVGGLLL